MLVSGMLDMVSSCWVRWGGGTHRVSVGYVIESAVLSSPSKSSVTPTDAICSIALGTSPEYVKYSL